MAGFTRSKRALIASALLLTLLGFALRFYRLSGQSLWTDEVSSIEVAQAPLAQIYQQSAIQNNSLPTYFLVLRWLVGGARTDVEFRARSLSALAGALSIPVFIGLVYLWKRTHLTPNPGAVALLAGLLLTINPLHLWYSQEVRAYALMLLFGLLSLLFFELTRNSPKLWWALLYIASGLMVMALHKTGLIFPLACMLWSGWSRKMGVAQPPSTKQLATKWLIHLPLVIGALIVLALKSYPPAEEYSRRSSGLEVLYTFLTFVGGYSFGPSLTEIQWHGPWLAVSHHLGQVGLMAALLGLVALACLLNWREVLAESVAHPDANPTLTKASPKTDDGCGSKRVPSHEFVLVLLGIGVVAIYALVSGFPYNVRYVLPALFGFLGLLAGLITTTKRPVLSRVTLLGVVLLALWADGQWFYGFSYRKADSRAVAQWLGENRDRIKSWTVLPGYLSRSVEWYLQKAPEMLSRSLPAKQDRTTSFPPVPDALLIGRRHHLQDPDKLVAEYQAAAGGAQVLHSFAGFEVYVKETGKGGSSKPGN